jgi:nitrite reductase/ring-hydroxylating ferredoxin subunit
LSWNLREFGVAAFQEATHGSDRTRYSSLRRHITNTNSYPIAFWSRGLSCAIYESVPRRTAHLFAKKNDKDEATGKDDGDEVSSFFSKMFKRVSKDEDDSIKDGESSPTSSIPIVGRFFVRGDKDEGEEDENDEKKSGVRSVVGRYLQSRQLRKDAEALREEVLRREESKRLRIEEQKMAVEDAREKLRAASGSTVRESRQEEVKREVEKLRRIEAQKVVDLQRLERLEKARLEREMRQQGLRPNGADKAVVFSSLSRQSASEEKQLDEKKDEKKKKKEDEENDKSSSTSGFNVVSLAQKYVSGLFSKEEEWIVVAPKTRISPGELVPLTVAGIDLLLVASKDGSALHCIANSCPHLGTPLEIGTLERRPIENRSSNNILNGEATAVPGEGAGATSFFQENDITRMLKQDGCEDCIVCPLHKTAFALESGEVRGEWCPYPPVIGKLTGAIKPEANLAVFDVRTKGKNIEVRLNTPVVIKGAENDSRKIQK